MWAYAQAHKAPGSVSFYPDEMRRIRDCELILDTGLSLLELGYEFLSVEMYHDLLEMKVAREAIKRGKLPYQN